MNPAARFFGIVMAFIFSASFVSPASAQLQREYCTCPNLPAMYAVIPSGDEEILAFQIWENLFETFGARKPLWANGQSEHWLLKDRERISMESITNGHWLPKNGERIPMGIMRTCDFIDQGPRKGHEKYFTPCEGEARK